MQSMPPTPERSTEAEARPSADLAARLLATLRDVPDFPRPGIMFKDVTPLLADAALFRSATEAMAAPFAHAGVTHVAAVESRGLIFGAPIAQHLGAGFVPLRKPGKLPAAVRREPYALEYGSDALEIHEDACAGARVLVVDDVLATGGTLAAGCRLVEAVGGTVVGCAVLLALGFLGGRSAIGARRLEALLEL